MGADLYLKPIFKPNHNTWEKRFNQAIKKRDACDRRSPEWQRRQEEATECFERMYDSGYFRDPYNDSSVLWQFGLSWAQNVAPLLDDQDRLSVKRTKELLHILEVASGSSPRTYPDFPKMGVRTTATVPASCGSFSNTQSD